MTSQTETKFFVVPAPGHYGDRDIVYGAFATLDEARRSIKPSERKMFVVREGAKAKGDTWLRSSESIYPVAQ